MKTGGRADRDGWVLSTVNHNYPFSDLPNDRAANLVFFGKNSTYTIFLTYEIYKYFNDSMKLGINNETLISNMIKVMKLMIPFTPHLAYECLEKLKCKSVNKRREIKKDILLKKKDIF